MELLILPAIGIAGMYYIKRQDDEKKVKKENFESLPNTNIPDKNYPSNRESDLTSMLSTQNKFDGSNTYTDKYFNKEVKADVSKGAQYTSLSGQPVDISYFSHNNMAPFFGSKTHTNNAANSNETCLDNYTGSGSQHISKKEQSPMFSPGQNNDWTHGMPSTTDFIQSRVNPSSKMTGVKPFESIQVGPGLGLGADTKISSHGLNNGMMSREKWMDKNVDELRVSNKQKASGLGMLGYEGPAKSYITERGNIGIVEKNRVTKTFEMGADRLLTTTGVEKGPTLRSIQVEKNVNRANTSVEYIGGASYKNSAQHMEGSKYTPSNKIELGPVSILPAYANGKGNVNESDYGKTSNMSYMNNRTVPNNDSGYFGVVGGTFGSIFAPILDVLKPSRRENTIGNLRPYQNAKSQISNSYAYNPADKPDMTNRELTENSKYHLTARGSQAGGYQTTGVTMPHNVKETTSDIVHIGNAVSAHSKPRRFDAENAQQCNEKKSSTIEGRLVQGNMKLMNSNVNMTSKAKENIMLNVRLGDRKLPSQAPSVSMLGEVQGNSINLYASSQLDRSDGRMVVNQLNDNPYKQNILNGL